MQRHGPTESSGRTRASTHARRSATAHGSAHSSQATVRANVLNMRSRSHARLMLRVGTRRTSRQHIHAGAYT
eukprot:2956404-Pleurochrysis_carterae.AAC.1